MKRVIIDIPDEYAGAVSVTAIGNHYNENNQIVTNVKSTVIELKEDVTTAQITFEEGEE
jgi:hypothetical protein|nr:MAG TPA: hypothetical protein [Caudoviricetes sp.]